MTEEQRLGLWRVFGYYRIQQTGRGAIAVADRTVPWGVKVKNSQRDTRSFDVKVDGRERRIRRRNISEPYMPLKEHPDLFYKFARLAHREIEREEWLGWLHEYGVLGVLHSRAGRYQRNDRTDSFSGFVHEALLAKQTLELFDAVAVPDGLDIEVVRRLLPERYGGAVGDEPGEVERAALQAVEDTIHQKVHPDCFERLIPRDTGVWRKKRLSPFARRWEFTSLLGAMWLQFKWLVSMDGPRYCENPDCRKIIPPYRRNDAKTCDDACRQNKRRKS